ncbi:MAG: tetratricopeptide repeat protein [Gammaproteobacteria bacterium]|nr:tetratricopeptide repeat protein [Gammaproteobacteria bacterium]MDH5800773.1 tetratricopeptide repeat protein [Gammaproteobacteria bacterium]
MKAVKFFHFSVVLFLLALVCDNSFAVEIEWSGLRDPSLQESLFDSYQGRHFAAITRLQSHQKLGRIKKNQDRAGLVLGGLYLSYGFHQEAASLFEAFLEKDQPRPVSDRAWFYLAKTQYQRGRYPEALDALARIKGQLDSELRAERVVLEALILMRLERFSEASRLLAQESKGGQWWVYGKYNMAMALAKTGKKVESAEILDELGKLRVKDDEAQHLKDRANLVLGYEYLGSGEPEKAKAFLKRIYLDGVHANRGLLGLGRAYSTGNEHEKSLIPWLQLIERDPSDPHVQEALMAVPYAFGQLEAYKQSLQYYEKAMLIFQEEITKINSAANAIAGGKLIEGILRTETGEADTGAWTMKKVLDSPEGRYLWPVIASYEFSETLFNYKQLRFSLGKLESWSATLPTYQTLNQQNYGAYQTRINQLQAQVLLASEKLNHHLQRLAYKELEQRKKRLVGYFNQARFSVAQIYDYSAKRWGVKHEKE